MAARHLLLDNLLAALGDLGLKSYAFVHHNSFLNNQVFLLKEPPILLEKFEATLNCLYIFECHSKLILFNKEANFVSTINCILIILIAFIPKIIVEIIILFLLINFIFTWIIWIALTTHI